MDKIQKIQPTQIQPRQLPDGYALVRTSDLAKMQRRSWSNAPDPVSDRANAQGVALLKWCGMALAGCVALAVLINALKPAPQPIIINRPAPTPTPAPAGNNDSCLESCWSIW